MLIALEDVDLESLSRARGQRHLWSAAVLNMSKTTAMKSECLFSVPCMNFLGFFFFGFVYFSDTLIAQATSDFLQVYGYQNIKAGTSSEQLLGRFVSNNKSSRMKQQHPQGEDDDGKHFLSPVFATKFFTIPWTNFLVGQCSFSLDQVLEFTS